MNRVAWWLSLILAACTSAPVPAGMTPGPSPTLRSLPTAGQVASPALPATLPSDTPAPTLTPLPTATPIVHVVQSGDTLIGIAVKYNVSLEALEAANPGINPQNLQPGQAVIVPAAMGESAPSGGILPTPLAVEVGSFNCVPTPVASLTCFGEFVNSLDQPITNLSVEVTLLNADNSIADSVVVYASLDLVPPGVSVPLGAVFASGPRSERAAIGQVLTADSGLGLADRFTMLAVSEVVGALTTAGFTLSGTVSNTGGGEAHDVVIVGTVYNSAATVAGYRKIAVEQPLASGASLPFSITLPGVSSAARWAVIAQGRTQ